MERQSGIAVSPGIAIGPIRLARASIKTDDRSDEMDQHKRFHEAIERSREQINALKERMETVSEEEAAIFETHIFLLEDPMFFDEIDSRITEKHLSAEESVEQTTADLCAMFEGLEDAYLRARASDIRDIGGRILRNLKGDQQEMPHGGVWVSMEMLPSDVAAAHECGVEALACERGALNSHAAILARSLDIPTVFGLKGITTNVSDGDILIVDGNSGFVIVGSDEAVQEEYRKKASSTVSSDTLKHLRGKILPGDVHIKANIASVDEAAKAFTAGADGIGVVRTEFIFADRETMPDENEQYGTYLAILNAVQGKSVAIRTLDAGSDKPLNYLPIPSEPNPSLGLRGLRLSLTMPEVFKVQLRAILRAAQHGDTSLFFPMVTNAEELKQALALVRESENDLKQEGIPFGQVKIGAMIEVPSAALNAMQIAEHVDFMSIGTNDLVQYTLAVDRINSSVAHLYNELDPAVLELIARVVQAGKEFNIPVSVCGEMAANLQGLPTLLELGVRELSMSATSIERIRTALETLST